MQLLKIALNMPMEHCNHCQYHLHDSIHTPSTFLITSYIGFQLYPYSH